MALPLYNNARKVPAGRSPQSCFLEPSRDIPDVAGLIAAAEAKLVYCAAQKSEIAALIGLEDFVEI